jgi:DNA-binding NtrC family response regulator
VSAKLTVFIVDDEPQVARAAAVMLRSAGMETVVFERGQTALDALRDRVPQAALLDLMLPDLDGIELLRRMREIAPEMPVVMMSGQGTVRTAVEALKLGAYDFVEKPFDAGRLQSAMNRALECGRLRRQVSALESELGEQYRMVGESVELAQVRELVRRVAPTRVNVLITGESGAGKELVARALHMLSPRKGEPFVALNCAAIPKELVESELFGHERGAFTGAEQSRKGKLEEADGGTFLLDEVGDMSMAAQAKSLRFLENSEVQRVGRNEPVLLDVRVIAATNKDLPEAIKAGQFREDLYHRLNVVTIDVPPLRRRPADIETLAEHFLAEFCRRHNRALVFAPGCGDVLRAHSWPGNVRELRNVVERTVVLGRSNPLSPQELRGFIGITAPVSGGGTLAEVTTRAERAAVEQALAASGGCVATAARMLGIERPSLYRIMKRHGLSTKPEAS